MWRRLTNTDNPRRWYGRIVQNALSYFIVQMAAIVIRFYATSWFVCIGVEGVEMSADSFHWCEVLVHLRQSTKVRGKRDVPVSQLRRFRESCS